MGFVWDNPENQVEPTFIFGENDVQQINQSRMTMRWSTSSIKGGNSAGLNSSHTTLCVVHKSSHDKERLQNNDHSHVQGSNCPKH